MQRWGVDNWTGAVLAGGKSSRMGEDKALLMRNGKTMLDHALDLVEPATHELMIVGDPATYGHVHPNTVADIRPHCGPLGGITSVLHYSSNDQNLIIGCDMPNLTQELFTHLKALMHDGTDAVIPVHGGLIEPLVGVYHRRCAPTFKNCIENTVFKMSDALALVSTTFVEVHPGVGKWPAGLFKNINSKEDL